MAVVVRARDNFKARLVGVARGVQFKFEMIKVPWHDNESGPLFLSEA